MALNFTQKQPSKNSMELKRITGWVEDALPESLEDVMVMVNELQCFEPVSAQQPPIALALPSLPAAMRSAKAAFAASVRLSPALLVTPQGCAPLETVISLLGQQSIVFKIFKPAELVQPEDVFSGVQSILTGGTPPEHLQVVQQAGRPLAMTAGDDAMTD